MAWSQSSTVFIQFKCFSAVDVGTVIKHLWRASSGVMCEWFSAVGEGTVIGHLWRAASGVMGTSLQSISYAERGRHRSGQRDQGHRWAPD